MGEKLIVGPITNGLRTAVEPFNIDNDSFPVLQNAYQWRGRILRKRGTILFGRCTRFFNSNSTAYSATSTITLDGGGNGNLLSGFGLEATGSLVIGSAVIVAPGPTTFRDLTNNGYLTPTGTGGPNTINYATGAILIPSKAGAAVTATFQYFPGLPVLGIEDLNLAGFSTLGTLVFDETYSYNVNTAVTSNGIYDVSFYKNLATNTYPLYVQKTTPTNTTWNGQNYQQFQSTNYQGAFWVTNGINVPFSASSVGMQFAPAPTITYTSNTPTTINLTITSCPLVKGDFVFFNEWTDTAIPAGSVALTLNFQTGYVTSVSGSFASLNIVVTLPNAALAAGTYVPGIIQYLTNRSNTAIDCIRWYDGDPTNGSLTSPVLIPGNGWVNFMPPLSRSIFSIADLPAAQYYLVGARYIQQFKDRIVFFGPVVQTSVTGATAIYLQDTIIYSQNGTPYYTASFIGDPSLSTTTYTPLLVPTNQTSTPNAYWEDQTGFGGFVSAGINFPLLTAISNEDVLIVGTPGPQMRLVYTGDDLLPFNFYFIDAELNTNSTFSAINMGNGVITRGNRGFIITTQREATRIDIDILDEIFKINLQNNGNERFTAQRDFISEWIYFTYNPNFNTNLYPSETLLYNYRDNSWAKFDESYTHYGQFQRNTTLIWSNVGNEYGTWAQWNDPWNASDSDVSPPVLIAGNHQGFLLIRADAQQGTTGEGNSLYIQGFSGGIVTSPNHNLSNGDYIFISGATGGSAGISGLNGSTYSVAGASANTFTLNPNPVTTGTYIGGGVIQKMYVPFIQTKQFPSAWGLARKTRIGVQQYLLSATQSGQITLLIFLSQNGATPYNIGGIIPGPNTLNSALVYSTVLFTCPESTNLGLTAANATLMTITDAAGASAQQQIWHRINTSLIGDTIQLGFTLSDAQMRDPNRYLPFAEIQLHGFVLDITPSQLLS